VARKLSPKGWSPVNLLAFSIPQPRLCFASYPQNNRNIHNTNLSSISAIGAPGEPVLVSSVVRFHERRKGGHCTMNQIRLLRYLGLLHLAFAL
jgi:hypothetical protein